ncbi:MAG: GntR family transcriptional regulator [Rectinemataceae bacterium]|nr:GntR family transcriptional regulator [Rectinemataceae bacterium]
MTKKIVTLSMRDQIYEALRESIIKNAYAPNSVLPIDHLAEDFGVSATPVREALVRLEAEGLVTLIPNKGALVTDIQAEDILNNWEMRQLLEPYAAGKSTSLIPEAELKSIRAEISDMKKSPFDNDRYVACDTRMHEILYIHLPNAFLKDSIRRVHQMSLRIRYFPEDSKSMHEQAVNEVITEHLAIVDALENRDPAKISETVLLHLRNGEKRAMAALLRKR